MRRVLLVLTAVVALMFLSGPTISGIGVGYQIFIPLVMRAPTPRPMPGVNVVCTTVGEAEICGSVAKDRPARRSVQTVYGRLTVNGAGQGGLTMNTTWHYKTTVAHCSGTTGSDGVAQCGRNIGGATPGYRVNVDVEIGGYTVTTWFTPR